MKVKICGLRRLQDAELALALGATHLGIVLAPDSPRRATLDQARTVVAAAVGRAEPVLVFRSVRDDAIAAMAEALGVRRVQVHGRDVDAARLARLRARGLTPVPVARIAAGATSLPTFALAPSEAEPALLDGGDGGAGVAFDWSLFGGAAPSAVFIAGGIRPENVRSLLRHRPWGLDVSSGVERAPGHKDHERMRALFEAIARAEVER